jgi:hypothetical protein
MNYTPVTTKKPVAGGTDAKIASVWQIAGSSQKR